MKEVKIDEQKFFVRATGILEGCLTFSFEGKVNPDAPWVDIGVAGRDAAYHLTQAMLKALREASKE